jgi:nucleotidyltransferase AbiEii toxin of type IV toxin-antitoxin system
MGRAPARTAVTLPADLLNVLSPDAARAWQELARVLPEALYLGGGTAVAAHLHHRQSRDLDFFFHDNAVDLAALAARLGEMPRFSVAQESSGTLRGLFGATKLEFFHADEAKRQRLLEAPGVLAGLRIAGLKDLLAMKLKVVGDRGELRDYYDLRLIEERGGLTIEDGIPLFLERYDVSPQSDTLQHIVRALGYLDDIEEDDALPISKAELAEWWRERQVRLLRHLARNPA